jgi:hypothetical protein
LVGGSSAGTVTTPEKPGKGGSGSFLPNRLHLASEAVTAAPQRFPAPARASRTSVDRPDNGAYLARTISDTLGGTVSTTAYEKISDDELDAIVGGRLVLPIVNMKLLTIQSA